MSNISAHSDVINRHFIKKKSGSSDLKNILKSYLAAFKRYLFFLLWAPFCYSYARYRFIERTPEIMEPEKTWDILTNPNRIIDWLADHHPPKLLRVFVRNIYYRHSYKFKNHAVGINEHYSLSNDFFKLFLDKKYMFYTCADFINKNDTIEDAQENKANHILGLIDPKPGEKILELGCGWGSMMKKIYSITGDKENLTGWTIATAQIEYIREMGFMVDDVNYCTAEFKENSYDKIYSIGALESVREKELLRLSQNLRKAIRPGGKVVHHYFCQLHDVFHPNSIFAALSIFPGCELATLETHLKIFDQSGFRVTHHSVHDYRPTLRAWFDRLVENRDRAIELVGVKNYNKYLAYFAMSYRCFDKRLGILNRFVLEPV